MPMELNLPAGYYHANMLFTGAGVPKGAAVTFGGQNAAGSATAIATAINTAWNTHLKAAFSVECTHIGTRVKIGPMEDGPFAMVAASNIGGLAGNTGAPQVSALIRKNTAIGGRQGAGRMYQPAVPETSVDSAGNLLAATRTTLQSAWSAFLAALNSGGWPMFLLHSHGAYRVLTPDGESIKTVAARAPTEVTSLSVDSIVATQRRRLRG